MKDCTWTPPQGTKLPQRYESMVNLSPKICSVYIREMFCWIHFLASDLNSLEVFFCLMSRGMALNNLEALHLKLSLAKSKSGLLVCLICPLLACLVLQLYLAENMEKRYLGDSVWRILCTNTTEWYTANC